MRARALLTGMLAAVTAGCGDGDAREVFTVYASVPRHGPSTTFGQAAATGMRVAWADARRRAGAHHVRLRLLPSARAGRAGWDPESVRRNARIAAADPLAAAYIGELDHGASVVSLPITHRAGLLQVSPADGMTSLGRTMPFGLEEGFPGVRPRDETTFVRLVPPDLDSAREIAARLERLGVRRLAVVHDERPGARELEQLVLVELRDDRPRRLLRVSVAGHAGPRELARRVTAFLPDAVLYTGNADSRGRAVVEALADASLAAPLIGGPSLAAGGGFDRVPRRACAWTGVPEPRSLPARGRRLLARIRARSGRDVGVAALLGHAAMRLALDAIAHGGADRRSVARRARASVDFDEVAIGYGLGSRAHFEGDAVACQRLSVRRPAR